MRLFIAEKPDLAKDIANALTDGNYIKKNGYFECKNNDRVTWCYGHLLKSIEPEGYNPNYKRWNTVDLPLKLFPLRYEPIPDKKSHTDLVINLINQADEIVHAGDPDDEGQLLVDELLIYANNRKPVKRILINDNNLNAVKKALNNLKDNRDFYGIYQKTYARSAGDLLYGLSMTRAYTLEAKAKGYQGVLSVGRVQTPILGLIVRRWLAHQAHETSFYYLLDGLFTVEGKSFSGRFKPAEEAPKDDKGRVINKNWLEQVGLRCNGQAATVTDSCVKEKETTPPLPFNLVKLQQQMNKEFGMTAAQTLAVTQSLREKYKAITYNRSDCRYLSDEQFEEAPQTLAALKQCGTFAGVLTDSTIKGKAFDNSNITAHTAIIPTANVPKLEDIREDERRVYQAIARQYLVQFMPNKKYLEASGTMEVNGDVFSYKALKTTVAGFAVLINNVKENEDSDDDNATVFDIVSQLQQGQTGLCLETKISEKKTTPPPLFTEATLLAALVHVADFIDDVNIKKLLKEKDKDKKYEQGGIGTPATRSEMLEILKRRNFIVVQKGKLVPTETGVTFFKALPAIATQPDMTALWAEQQSQIEKRQISVDDFITTLMDFLTEQVKQVNVGEIKLETKSEGKNPRLEVKCPHCGNEIVISPKVFSCSGCDFKVWSTIADKKISRHQIETLILKGKTNEIKGFTSKKTGKFFSAKLILQDKASGEIGF